VHLSKKKKEGRTSKGRGTPRQKGGGGTGWLGKTEGGGAGSVERAPKPGISMSDTEQRLGKPEPGDAGSGYDGRGTKDSTFRDNSPDDHFKNREDYKPACRRALQEKQKFRRDRPCESGGREEKGGNKHLLARLRTRNFNYALKEASVPRKYSEEGD